MIKQKWHLAFAVLLMVFTMGLVSCSSSNNGGGGGASFVDLAVGDKMMNSSSSNGGSILLWFNILNFIDAGSAPAPDVTISTSEVDAPSRMLFWNGDLFVVNTGENVGPTGNISIYRDYLTLANDASADVKLGLTGSLIADPKFMVITNNDLVVADWGTDSWSTRTDDRVSVFRDVDTLASNDVPDLILDHANSLISSPRGLAVSTEGDLYVGNWDELSGGNCVLIFRDLANLASQAVPDAILSETVSFSGLMSTYSSGGCRDVLVNNDILYVTFAYSDLIFIFNNASTLATDALPDAVLSGSGTGSFVNTPTSLTIVNDTLFVTNHNFDPSTVDTYPGLVAFNGVGSLTDAQSPDGKLGTVADLAYADRVAFAGNAMFVTGGHDNTNSTGSGAHSSLYIYLNNGSGSFTDQAAQMIIAGDDATSSTFVFDYPTGLAATNR